MDPSFVIGIISIPTTCVTPKGDTKCSGRTRTKCSVRCSGYGSASFPASSISFSTSASLNRCISFLAVVAVSCPLLSFSTWITGVSNSYIFHFSWPGSITFTSVYSKGLLFHTWERTSLAESHKEQLARVKSVILQAC